MTVMTPPTLALLPSSLLVLKSHSRGLVTEHHSQGRVPSPGHSKPKATSVFLHVVLG